MDAMSIGLGISAGGRSSPQAEEALKAGVQRLYAMERGMVAVFDELDGKLRFRKVAVNAVMLMETADRHLVDLARLCRESGWPTNVPPCPFAEAWREEVEASVFFASPSPVTDALGLALLRNAVHLKLPRYESLRLLAQASPHPGMDLTLRMAAEDERIADERLLRMTGNLPPDPPPTIHRTHGLGPCGWAD